MRILALDAALAQCAAGVIVDDRLIAERHETGARGQAALLPPMAEAVLAEAGLDAASLDLVAVTLGPGSFTGLRAALALAHGIALAAGRPVVGVTVGEALAEALPGLTGRELWSAVDSRRGRVFLERAREHAGEIVSLALTALPAPAGPVAVAGDAAAEVASRLAARGVDVMLTDARQPRIRHVALAAARRHAGGLPPREALPVYVDPPEAKLPAGGLRPPPA